jgi:hypothetical protein
VTTLVLAALTASVVTSTAAYAQSGAAGDYTPAHAREAFAAAGYAVGPIASWDWALPPVSAFRVTDAQHGRVLLVAVYPDVEGAQMGARRLPTGYTASIWIYNLALFEATQDDYRQLTEAALRAATGMDPAEDLRVAWRESGGVERQYTDLLLWGPSSACPPVETLIPGPRAPSSADFNSPAG